jgi:hypothetical protein
MALNNQKVAKLKRDRTNENFAKRIETLISKCNELREYQADVFLFACRRGKSYTYNSRSGRWVPTEEDMVSNLRIKVLLSLTTMRISCTRHQSGSRQRISFTSRRSPQMLASAGSVKAHVITSLYPGVLRKLLSALMHACSDEARLGTSIGKERWKDWLR